MPLHFQLNFQTSTQFTAEYIFSKPPDTGNLESGLTNISTLEYWHLSRTSDPGNDAACYITLYFPDQARSQITDISDLAVAHYNASIPLWENLAVVHALFQ